MKWTETTKAGQIVAANGPVDMGVFFATLNFT